MLPLWVTAACIIKVVSNLQTKVYVRMVKCNQIWNTIGFSFHVLTMFCPSVFVHRSRNPSGSPRPRSVKKVHFIKNMRQYDTRGSRCVYSLLHVVVWVFGCVWYVSVGLSFPMLVMFSPLCASKQTIWLSSSFSSQFAYDPLQLLYAVLLYDSCEDIISLTVSTQIMKTHFLLSNLLKGPYFVLIYLFCAINE